MREPLAPFEFYHVFNRGTDKRRVFLSKVDYARFITLLHVCNGDEPVHVSNLRGKTPLEIFAISQTDRLVEIGAYCLMPNHFHLLLRQVADQGISRFMQKLMTGYTMYFNKRNDRSGVLFQGKYKSVHVENDRHLKYLLSYIHLNPSKSPFTYEYSSILDYLGSTRPQGTILRKDCLPQYFSKASDLRKELREWLAYAESIKVGP